ncbi:MAG: hypothetical protein N3G22_03255 [Candidatus Micrarchaeota archaeon]|nr:hypothetical protein [Candidatus Micrarchaeota archaeon]
MKEDERQLVHILLGLFGLAATLALGRIYAAYAMSAVVLAGLVLVHLKLSGKSLGPLEPFLHRFERPGVTPGYGALTMAAGSLAIITLLEDASHVLASLVILGLGDAGSTLVGLRSKKKLPWSRDKTFGGTAAFVLFSLPAVYFAGAISLLVATMAALAESLESNVDDNLIVALVCVVAFRLLSGIAF